VDSRQIARAACVVKSGAIAAGCAFLIALVPLPARPQLPQVIEVLADHDSRWRMAGMKEPMITVHAGEVVTLRITAVKAKEHNRNGAIHGFTLLRAKDRSRVPGWDFELKPGVQEFALTVPKEPGEYIVVCTVICSGDHEGMHMRFVVLP
jgi:heme/copper-type cytochrome/quinol oxidase subunit 2